MSKVYYRGQDLFLYVKFEGELEIINPMFRITYEKDGNIEALIDWKDLQTLSDNEFYENAQIDFNANYSIYEIEYICETIDNKIARVIEEFHVIPKSEKYPNAVKLYGFINQARVGYPLIGTSVEVHLLNNNAALDTNGVNDSLKIVSESYTKEDGRWEAYLYPGEYKFIFKKYGFKEIEVIAQIGSEQTEVQFDNITLESNTAADKGNGIYTISDNFVTKEGVPLNNLIVTAYSVLNIKEVYAKDVTDDDGEWSLFLDPGMYLLKVLGNSLMDDFELTFRLRVEEDGTFSQENLTTNVGTPIEELSVGRGDMNSPTSKTIEDTIIDNNGNPIIDVQVCVYLKSDLNKLIAQDYTDVRGSWIVYLEPNNYVFEYYHPEFIEHSEDRTVR